MNDMNKSGRMSQLKNPFFTSNATNILMFFAGWGIWWSFFQIWLTTKQGFTGAQVGEIYSFNSAFSLIANLVYSNIQDRLGLKRNLLIFCACLQVLLGPFFTFLFVPMLHANLELGALIGSCYLTLAYLSASPMFEALTERASRRFNYQYGQRVLGARSDMPYPPCLQDSSSQSIRRCCSGSALPSPLSFFSCFCSGTLSATRRRLPDLKMKWSGNVRTPSLGQGTSSMSSRFAAFGKSPFSLSSAVHSTRFSISRCFLSSSRPRQWAITCMGS